MTEHDGDPGGESVVDTMLPTDSLQGDDGYIQKRWVAATTAGVLTVGVVAYGVYGESQTDPVGNEAQITVILDSGATDFIIEPPEPIGGSESDDSVNETPEKVLNLTGNLPYPYNVSAALPVPVWRDKELDSLHGRLASSMGRDVFVRHFPGVGFDETLECTYNPLTTPWSREGIYDTFARGIGRDLENTRLSRSDTQRLLDLMLEENIKNGYLTSIEDVVHTYTEMITFDTCHEITFLKDESGQTIYVVSHPVYPAGGPRLAWLVDPLTGEMRASRNILEDCWPNDINCVVDAKRELEELEEAAA